MQGFFCLINRWYSNVMAGVYLCFHNFILSTIQTSEYEWAIEIHSATLYVYTKGGYTKFSAYFPKILLFAIQKHLLI